MNERNGNRKRSRKRGGRSGDAPSGGGRNPAPKGGKQKGSAAKRKRPKGPKPDPAVFWGDVATLPDFDLTVRPSPDVTAVVSSLGRPPAPGHETAAEHWFNLVYERAGVLAGALAAAGGLDDNDATGDDAPTQ